jgi:hypothetical protein
MNRSTLGIVTVLMALLATQAGKVAAEDQINCTPAPDPKYKDVMIDLTNGNLIGSQRFLPLDQVRLIFINKNPFRYDYRIQIQEVELKEYANAYLKKAFGQEAFGGIETVTAVAGKPPVTPLAHPCPTPVTDKYKSFEGELEDGLKILLDVDDTLIALTGHLAQIDRVQKSVTSENASCEDMSTLIPDLLNKIDEYRTWQTDNPDWKPNVNRAATALKKLSQLKNAIATWREGDLKKEAESCQKAITKKLDGVLMPTLEEALKLKSGIETIDETDNRVQAMQSRVESVRRNPNAFYEIRYIGGYPTRHSVNIKVFKRDLEDETNKYEELKSINLMFGTRSVFSLSGGIGWSPLDNKTYTTVQSTVTDGTGQQTVVTVIAYEQDSNNHFFLPAMVNLRLTHEAQFGFHLTIGAAPLVQGNQVTMGFLGGGSLSVASDRGFIFLGVFTAMVEELAGKLEVGQVVPGGFGAAPVKTKRGWGLGLALTYRLLT